METPAIRLCVAASFCAIVFLILLVPPSFSVIIGSQEFRYRRPITVDRLSPLPAGASEEEVLFVLNTKKLNDLGKIQSSCTDVVFYFDSDPPMDVYMTLPFFLESGCGLSKTQFWISVPWNLTEFWVAYGATDLHDVMQSNVPFVGGSFSFFMMNSEGCSPPFFFDTRFTSSNERFLRLQIRENAFQTIPAKRAHNHLFQYTGTWEPSWLRPSGSILGEDITEPLESFVFPDGTDWVVSSDHEHPNADTTATFFTTAFGASRTDTHLDDDVPQIRVGVCRASKTTFAAIPPFALVGFIDRFLDNTARDPESVELPSRFSELNMSPGSEPYLRISTNSHPSMWGSGHSGIPHDHGQAPTSLAIPGSSGEFRGSCNCVSCCCNGTAWPLVRKVQGNCPYPHHHEFEVTVGPSDSSGELHFTDYVFLRFGIAQGDTLLEKQTAFVEKMVAISVAKPPFGWLWFEEAVPGTEGLTPVLRAAGRDSDPESTKNVHLSADGSRSPHTHEVSLHSSTVSLPPQTDLPYDCLFFPCNTTTGPNNSTAATEQHSHTLLQSLSSDFTVTLHSAQSTRLSTLTVSMIVRRPSRLTTSEIGSEICDGCGELQCFGDLATSSTVCGGGLRTALEPQMEEEVFSERIGCPENDVCRCWSAETSFWGRECEERIGHRNGSFLDTNRSGFRIPYWAPMAVVVGELDDLSTLSMPCSSLIFSRSSDSETCEIANWDCSFEMDNRTLVTSFLTVSLSPSSSISPTSVFIRPISDPDVLVEIPIEDFDPPLIFDPPDPRIWVPVAASLGAAALFLFVIVVFVVAIIGICLLLASKRQRELLCKLQELEDVDLLLREQEMRKSNADFANIKVDQQMFELEMEDVKLITPLAAGGGAARVYKVEYRDRMYAFKLFNCTMFGNVAVDVVQEFEREVGILASARHPNILRFYGAACKLPKIGFLMELCLGDLRWYLFNPKQPECSFVERLRLLFEICHALQYLHSLNIIHRDLKLLNVLVTRDGGVRVMDFGMSRVVEDISVRAQLTHRIVAPEVFQGLDYSRKVDVFSFAILAWIVFAHDLKPYASFSTPEFRVSTDPKFRPSLKRLRDETPTWVIELLVRCWSNDPDERPEFSEIASLLRSEREKLLRAAKGEEGVDQPPVVQGKFGKKEKLESEEGEVVAGELEKDESEEESNDDDEGGEEETDADAGRNSDN